MTDIELIDSFISYHFHANCSTEKYVAWKRILAERSADKARIEQLDAKVLRALEDAQRHESRRIIADAANDALAARAAQADAVALRITTELGLVPGCVNITITVDRLKWWRACLLGEKAEPTASPAPAINSAPPYSKFIGEPAPVSEVSNSVIRNSRSTVDDQRADLADQISRKQRDYHLAEAARLEGLSNSDTRSLRPTADPQPATEPVCCENRREGDCCGAFEEPATELAPCEVVGYALLGRYLPTLYPTNGDGYTALVRLSTLESVRAELETARAAIVDKVMHDTYLLDMICKDGSVDFRIQGGAAKLLAEMLAHQYKESGAENYIETTFTSQHLMQGEQFVVTTQRVKGKTAHQLRIAAERERDALAQAIKECPHCDPNRFLPEANAWIQRRVTELMGDTK